MVQERYVFWPLVVATVFACWMTCVSGIVEPIPMPDLLDECYKFRTQNVSVTEIPSQEINMYCITQFLYQTTDLRPQRPISNETISYAQELFRELLGKYQDHTRQKRQFGRSVRREVRTLSRREWNTFTDRINFLKRSPVGNINRYDALADIHRLVVRPAHNGPNFLGWHRIYLLLLEIAVRFPIPYWDSRLDFYMNDPTDSVLWTPLFFGGGFGAVTDGPFANWVTPGTPPPRLIRNIGNAGSLVSDNVEAVFTRNFHWQIVEPNRNPRFSLEAHHNGPHVWVDGQLSAPATAAQDPIFFLHHSFIDYLWSLFRRRQRFLGINPAQDYPRTQVPDQQPFQRMIPFFLRHIDGYNNFFESITIYAPSPSCPNNCGGDYLECFNGRCRSTVGMTPASTDTSAGSAAVAAFGARGAAAPTLVRNSFAGQARAQSAAAEIGALPIGERFRTAPELTDPRVRGDTLPNRPETRPSPARRRRSVSSNNETLTNVNSNQDTSQINRPYQNTFMINGASSIDLWAFLPVKIVFERPPEAMFESYVIKNGELIKTSDMFSPANYTGLTLEIKKKLPATYERCHVSGSGASKVYVQTDGIDYSGRYKDYAVVDERLPVSSSMTYVGVKKPTDGAASFYMTAYDSCGRVCRPQCLENGIYRPCSGTFRINSSFPKMYGMTYEDAVKGIWKNSDGLLSESNAAEIPVTFLCEVQSTWPWN